MGASDTICNTDQDRLKRSMQHALHKKFGAEMAPFAGFEMPVSYPIGVIKENLHAPTELASLMLAL